MASDKMPLESPSPPSSPDDIPSFLDNPLDRANPQSPPTVANMTTSSQPLGAINAARRPLGAGPPARSGATPMSADLAAKMKAFSLSRAGAPPARPAAHTAASAAPAAQAGPGGIPAGFKLPGGLNRPGAPSTNSSPAVAGRAPSMAERRGLKLGGLPGQAPVPNGPAAGRQKPKMTLSQMGGPTNDPAEAKPEESAMDKYKDYIDTNRGALKFPGKAVIHGGGVEFESGRTFSISLDELDTMDELGKGNYGTVYKARHARPKIRKQGQGLAGNKARGPLADEEHVGTVGTTGMVMAIKEIRLELDDAKFAAIIMELDILHRCISPYIIDFYGAFFQEGAVYICMEWMDGGSIDKIYGDGVPENVLRKITLATVQGLKSLKEEHNIIHRDVKPTNILMNTKGQVKICDFGVSGNLVASIAKTNIGCQSYMAPERISSGGVAQAGAISGGTYSVQSDIWSLGLTIIESALGRYPYPPETYDNIFSQLAAIVDGEPPDLPKDRFSVEARDFVAGCLNKIPKLRPTYPRLLEHPWLAEILKPEVITEEDEEAAERAHAAGENIAQTDTTTADTGFYDKEVGEWVLAALEKKRAGKLGKSIKPALHAVALDVVSPSPPDGSAEPVVAQS